MVVYTSYTLKRVFEFIDVSPTEKTVMSMFNHILTCIERTISLRQNRDFYILVGTLILCSTEQRIMAEVYREKIIQKGLLGELATMLCTFAEKGFIDRGDDVYVLTQYFVQKKYNVFRDPIMAHHRKFLFKLACDKYEQMRKKRHPVTEYDPIFRQKGQE